ncbi:ComEA family DNA-binding protein [Lacinutrix iliipiscaria]|uniref:ComEA family DNA-binding protein n=1 Tax=Lacinutrix iliipiscaria TaxID=1230532 RepID=A0ABW5WPF8_9FLAO
MSALKSHFTFTIKQRNGIFLLLTVIISLQCAYFFVDFSSEEIPINPKELALFYKEMDSLRLVEIEKRQPKIYPFNPNFITDYKGYTLGMTNEEIDRLLDYRKQNQWINSTKQFQQVTKVSDALLSKISPYFKFPDWVTNPKPKKGLVYTTKSYSDTPKTFEQKIDLNLATASQLQNIYGIGEAYSKRIIKYRNKVQGFIADVQLQEVYGLSSEVIERIHKEFTVKTPKKINKINLNTASRDELVSISYIDYEIAHHIIEHRTLIEQFKSLDELKKVKDFPIHKIEIIKLYLTLE